jgi:hypothetical protein
MVGQRRDVGNLLIADRDIGHGAFDADVLALADRDAHNGRSLGAADLDEPLRLRIAGRHRRHQHQRRRDCCELGEEPSPRWRACYGSPPRYPCPLPMPRTDGRSTTRRLFVHFNLPTRF